MKIARFLAQNRPAFGIVEGDNVKAIEGSSFARPKYTGRVYSLSQVKLLAPVTPKKVIAMALNYASHVHDAPVPSQPEPFFKPPTCIVGPNDTIILPKDSQHVEEEAELVVVIGKEAKGVSEAKALDYVLGYTCGNDVSGRPWQRGDKQWWRAKGSDTFGPIGPFIVTDLDPSKLDMWARINGKEVQHCHTSELLFGVPKLVSFISQYVTLEPGDLIFTGTSGTPVQLKDGDTVEVEIQGIGCLSNPVKAER